MSDVYDSLRYALLSKYARKRTLWERVCELTCLIFWRTPTNHDWIAMGEAPWLGWRFPFVRITCELLYDNPRIPSYNRWHRWVHHDFDRDTHVYAWWPLTLPAWLFYLWRSSALRWSVERWMQRRVADKPEGECYNFALLGCWRNPRRWTWRRTHAFSRKPPLGPRPAWLDSV